ncbi:hypothetical protein R3P38DRAFT_3378452 [Favolaschia claudopus]|uniref:Uncharacterized protein n=1 Tax=Favolaschia claudopus TaxID=2862362 RepID=A0AAV9Z9A1_9AGAR
MQSLLELPNILIMERQRWQHPYIPIFVHNQAHPLSQRSKVTVKLGASMSFNWKSSLPYVSTGTSPPMHQADVTASASCALPGTITRSSSHTNGPVPRPKAVSLKRLVAFSRNLRCKLGICGKHSKCDCALARISSLSFERLEADEQSIVCALWTLTGVPGAYDAARIVQPIQIEITIN